MVEEFKNGAPTKLCAVEATWNEYRTDLSQTLVELSSNMKMLVANTEHLHRFGVALDIVADKIESNNEKVLEAAINKENIPIATVNHMLEEISKNNSKLYSIFGFITIGLTIVIGVLLIGEKFQWIRTLY